MKFKAEVLQLNKLLASNLKYYRFFSRSFLYLKFHAFYYEKPEIHFFFWSAAWLWPFSTLLHEWHRSKCSLCSPPPPPPLFPDECKEAGLWGSRVYVWRLTGMPACIFITRYRVAKKYSLICVWVFGLFIGVFISGSNLVSNGSTINTKFFR